MRVNITDIYRIETLNSTYEIKVIEQDGEVVSTCKKMGKDGYQGMVKEKGTEYLEKLVIGYSFKVPGVVDTSNVQDYLHFVVSTEAKRTTVPQFFGSLADALVQQVRGQAVRRPPRILDAEDYV